MYNQKNGSDCCGSISQMNSYTGMRHGLFSWNPKICYCVHKSLLPVPGPYPEPHTSSPHLSYPISLWSILTLPSNLCLGLASGLFPLDFQTKIFYAFLISPMCTTLPCPSHPRVALEKLTVTQLVMKFPTFYRNKKFVIVFTQALHWSLS
jgi:hypothetical protein